MSENLEVAQSAIEPVKEKAKESVMDGLVAAGEIISVAGEVIGGIVGGIGEALGALGDLG